MDEELTTEQKALLQERQSELVKIVEAFASLEKSKEWETLKELVFDKELQGIENRMKSESNKPVIDTTVLYRLQGRKEFARQFCDVKRYVNFLVQQLEEIKKHTNI